MRPATRSGFYIFMAQIVVRRLLSFLFERHLYVLPMTLQASRYDIGCVVYDAGRVVRRVVNHMCRYTVCQSGTPSPASRTIKGVNSLIYDKNYKYWKIL
jgi:hypothetical protein